jgi:LPXTG-motif cell wall-anchored protein
MASAGLTVPAESAAEITNGVFFEGLEASASVQCDALDGDAPALPEASLVVDNLVFLGAEVLPGGFDPEVPNQAPIVVPALGSVAVNVQEWSVVDGYQILTTTALRVVSRGSTTEIGVVECGWPDPAGPAGLPATGPDGAAVIVAGGAGGAFILLGAMLFVRRRRVV